MNTYTTARRLQKTVTAGSGTYTYSYNNTNNPYRASSVTNGLTTESYSYDRMGHLLSTTISGSGGKKIVTSATYSSDGYRTETVTDASGNTISYAYGTADSLMLGLPTSVTAPNGTVTNTVYDQFGRVTQTGIANTANLLYTYDKGNLETIQRTDNASNTQTYSFTHDAFGNNLSIKVGDRELAAYEYAANNGYLVKQTDANGNTVTFAYDHLGRVKTATYSGGLVLTYTYTDEGALYSVTATEDGNTTTYLYGYDSLGRMISGERLDNGTSILRTRQAYDTVNRPVYQAWQVGDTTYQEGYTYNSEEDGSLNTHHTATGETLTMQYDGLRRLSGITGGIYGKTYTYRDISTTQTTTQVASVVYDLPTDQSYGYTYDNMGNIATYTDANGTVTYTYDAQGQLLSATDGTTTYSYTYDTVGNILTANGHTYSYTNADWKDLLTAYDGETITYDAIGNPLSYYNGTRWAFTWEDGRQLATATDGTTNVSYTYDSDGIRTSKTVNGVKHTYVYASGKLLRETYGSNTLDFFYSTSGQPYALKHNGTTYYYITNLQGDVMSIVDGTGAVVAEYEYDPYGNILSTTGTLADTLGVINPLRYRGYVYDQECDLYYLQSRYYDPQTGRFINADAYASTGQGIIGNNMFAYCSNNPIKYTDTAGTRCEIADRGLEEGRPEVVTFSDGVKMSNDLLDFIIQNYADPTRENMYIRVTWLDRYEIKKVLEEKQKSLVFDIIMFPIPFSEKVSKIVDGVLLFYDFISMNVNTREPDGWYDHYCVSISWDTSDPARDGTIYSHYDYKLTYIWGENLAREPIWYLLSGQGSVTTREGPN